MSGSDEQTLSVQQPLPLAFVNGEALIEKPEDLYIPPDALEVILEAFEGPLDLLLYLIRKQKFDILNLPILQITRQYMEYVEVMKELKLELAAEYLLMAAILAEIKSRLLLPKRIDGDDEEEDPRAELIRRLREYEAVKTVAEELDGVPRMERDVFSVSAAPAEGVAAVKILPTVSLQELALSFQQVLKRAEAFEHHHIAREALSTRERMSRILEQVGSESYTTFDALFSADEGKAGVVVTFLALLELVKESLVELVQAAPFANIHVRLAGGA
ncbi:segregation/condensation protein A [Aestuariibacter halophilus]|uniref:Segregation and condensation protein A n=1 Tax=Fluctibacter halophilus TaxID=226011 RepID=A0ABS8G3U6_9ALTE|nr:ScpA family protein [Aestuariibacter halophilus]MCC2615267.1 segregation/condensation protein A [Aestuariibacter halophilus]